MSSTSTISSLAMGLQPVTRSCRCEHKSHVADAIGNRLDVPPSVELMRDPNELSGSATVVNSVSCILCHVHGLVSSFKDDMGVPLKLSGEAHSAVQALQPSGADCG